MQTVSVSRHINATPKEIWPLIADVRQIEKWHFNIASVDLLSPQTTGIGAARRCNFHDGGNVREDVVALLEERRIVMSLSEFSVPMKHLELEIGLAPLADHASEATLTLRYIMKYGLLGQILGATAVRRQLTAMAEKLLAGLDRHAATGENIGKDFFRKAA